MYERKLRAVTTAFVLIIVLAAVAYALQRNHARQSAPWQTYAGSGTAEDRDTERVRAELATAPQDRSGSFLTGRTRRTGRYPARHIRHRAA